MGYVVGRAAADEIIVDIFVISVCKVFQILCADDGGVVLAAAYIGGDGDVAVSSGKGELYHAGNRVGYGISLPHFKGGQVSLYDGGCAGDAGDEVDIVAVDREGAHVGLFQGAYGTDFREIHLRAAGVVAAQIHFAVHGAPYIKGVRGGVIDNIVRAVSGFIQRLGVVENALLFFKYKNAVSLRVVYKIDGSVAGEGVSLVDFIR